MNKITKLFISFTILSILIVPVLSFADPLVPCTNTVQTQTDANGNTVAVTNPDGSVAISSPCDFNAFLNLINNIIHFILFDMAIPIAAIMFLYAGFELVTSGGSTEKRGLAKKVATNAVIGLAIAAAAWLIVTTILTIVGYSGAKYW